MDSLNTVNSPVRDAIGNWLGGIFAQYQTHIITVIALAILVFAFIWFWKNVLNEAEKRRKIIARISYIIVGLILIAPVFLAQYGSLISSDIPTEQFSKYSVAKMVENKWFSTEKPTTVTSETEARSSTPTQSRVTTPAKAKTNKSSFGLSRIIWLAVLTLFFVWRLIWAIKPKDWNIKVHPETDVKSGPRIHYGGLVSCVGIWLVLVIVIIWPSIFNFFSFVVLFPFLWLLGGSYQVDIRFMLVITLMRKPTYNRLLLLRYKRLLLLRYKKQLNQKNLTERKLAELYLTNGLNITLLPSWLPGVDAFTLRFEKLEINRTATDFVPTKPIEIETDKGKNLVHGPVVSVVYKLTIRRYYPEVYLLLSEEDRKNDQNYQGVATRNVNAALTDYISRFSLDEVMKGDIFKRTFEPEEEDVRLSPFVLADGEGNLLGAERVRLYDFIENELHFQVGAKLIEFEVFDKNPDPDIEKAQKQIGIMEAQIQEARLKKQLEENLGAADAARVITQAQKIAVEQGMSFPEALKFMKEYRQAGMLTSLANIQIPGVSSGTTGAVNP